MTTISFNLIFLNTFMLFTHTTSCIYMGLHKAHLTHIQIVSVVIVIIIIITFCTSILNKYCQNWITTLCSRLHWIDTNRKMRLFILAIKVYVVSSYSASEGITII